ncbi:MAG: hypothetical protein A3I01_02390 [Betaproteobacteria bacterium RIFCSPLOWO2_02_FULL_65_24]|nr:MAG: hypothetical protein A3I01_02390 [Betaproteobacteria bacterium RIFCSPLOWO2_02_FULL_65_24]
MQIRYYESDVTLFLRDVVAAHPEIQESQREGRAMFWDHKVDFEALEREHQSEVPMKGYPYDSTVSAKTGLVPFGPGLGDESRFSE